MASPIELLFSCPNLDPVRAQILGLIPVFDRVARAGQTTIERSAKAQVKSQADAAKQIGKDTERAEKDRQRAITDTFRGIERALRDEQRLREQVNAVEVRGAQDAARERTRILENEARQAQSIQQRRARTFGTNFAGAGGRVLGSAGRLMGVAAAIGGGFGLAESLGSGIRNEATAGQIVRSSVETGGITGKDLQREARAAAIATGGKSEDMLAGVDAFVQKNGDLKTAVGLLGELSKEAASSGARLEDLGSTAAEVFSQVKDKAGTVDVMRTLIGQGKSGAIDIRNLGQYGARLTSSAGLFEGGVGENIKTFGGLAQVAKSKGGAVDAAEATEAAARVFSEIAEHKSDFESLGVKVRGSSGKLRNVADILVDTLVKTGGDITAIPKLFGRQAGKLEIGLAQSFLEGSGGRKDSASLAAGRASALAVIQSGNTPITDEQLSADVKNRLAENEAKLNIAMEALHAALNDKLLPRLPELIDAFSKLIPSIAWLADKFASFPMETIAAGMVASFGVELAKAQLGAFLREKIAEMMGSKGTPSPLNPTEPGTGGGPGGAMGMLGKVLGVGAVVSEMDKQVTGRIDDQYGSKLLGSVKQNDAASAMLGKGGPVTDEQKEEAARRVESLQRIATRGAEYKKEGPLDNIIGDVKALGSDLFGSGGSQNARQQDKAAASNLDALTESIAKAKAALDALGTVERPKGGGIEPPGAPPARWPP